MGMMERRHAKGLVEVFPGCHMSVHVEANIHIFHTNLHSNSVYSDPLAGQVAYSLCWMRVVLDNSSIAPLFM